MKSTEFLNSTEIIYSLCIDINYLYITSIQMGQNFSSKGGWNYSPILFVCHKVTSG